MESFIAKCEKTRYLIEWRHQGNQWNFDHDNPKNTVVRFLFQKTFSFKRGNSVIKEINRAGVRHFGFIDSEENLK